MLTDRVAKNLLYIEAVADIDRRYWEVGREKKVELTALQKKGQKKEVREREGGKEREGKGEEGGDGRGGRKGEERGKGRMGQ